MRQVSVYTTRKEFLGTYPSVRAAGRATGCSSTLVSSICKGKFKSAKGKYVFTYKEADKSSKAAADGAELGLYKSVMGYALRLCRDEELARDLVQEAYCQYYERYDPRKGKPFTFLCGNVRGQYMRHANLTMPTVCYELVAPFIKDEEEDAAEREENLAKREEAFESKVRSIFDTIPDKAQRERMHRLFNLYLQGADQKEIGDTFSYTPGMAKMSVIKMRRFVADSLGIPVREFTRYNCKKAV